MTKAMKKSTGFVLLVCMLMSLFAGATTAFAAKAFDDVPDSHWSKPYVDFNVDHGYFSGTSEKTFSPDAKMTRAMFVTVIGKVEGVSVNNNQKVDFSDVPAGKYYTGYVKWAADNGVVSGYPDGKFGPDDPITREQICVMMDKYIQYHDANNDTIYLDRKASVDFKDAADISSWAKDSVGLCVSYGLVQGFPDGKFYPKRNATRAEVAVMIYRLALVKKALDGEEYKVSYKYESGTEGAELPAAINVLILPDNRTFHTGDVAEAKDPAVDVFFADGKLWKFDGYKEKTVTVGEKDVEFVGVWVVDSEKPAEYSVKYAYVDVDGKTNVPVEVPTDSKTYKTGDKVTAVDPKSPVDTENGTWTFVGWKTDKTQTVKDQDIVFIGEWKYTATKFHVTYVAKEYGTGNDLPKEVAKELEGRCPTDDKAYDDGDLVWIKNPTSKSDYSDSTGRVWNYRGSSYSIVTRIKGADIEVIEYWGYAGISYVVNYSTEYVDQGGTIDSLSPADKRNLDKALPSPSTETHYSGETVTINYPVPMTVSKAENEFLLIPKYDVDGEWVFQHYKNMTTGDIYKPGVDETFRMPADSVVIKAYWKYFAYGDVNYDNANVSGDVETEVDKLLPKPNPTSEKVVPGDTITIKEPSKKTVTVNKVTYTYVGASVNSTDPDDILDSDKYTVKDSGDVNVYWHWNTKKLTVNYVFKPNNVPAGLIEERLIKESEELPLSTKEVTPSWNIRGKYQVYEENGVVWTWQGWDANKKYNTGSDITFVGTWTKASTPVAVYEFVNINKADGLDQEIMALEPDPQNVKKGQEFDLPDPDITGYDKTRWVFRGWSKDKTGKKIIDKDTINKSSGVTTYYGIWEYIGPDEIG